MRRFSIATLLILVILFACGGNNETHCTRVRAKLERFDDVISEGLGMYSRTERPWTVQRNPDGADLRRWDAIKLYNEYRDIFRRADRGLPRDCQKQVKERHRHKC